MNESREYSFSKLQLEEGSTATSYAPYVESKSSVILDEPLMSLPNGVCDEIIDLGDGRFKEIRRIRKLELAKLDLTPRMTDILTDTIRFFAYSGSQAAVYKIKPFSDGICNVIPYEVGSSADKFHCRIDGSKPYGIFSVWIEKAKLLTQDAEGFRDWIIKNNVIVYCELAEPIEIIHEATSLKTFEGTTHITSENYLPATITAKVPSNVNAVVMSLKEENKALALENEKLNNELSTTNENLEALAVEQGDYIFDNDYRITMLELGLA